MTKEETKAYIDAYGRVAIRFGSNVADELFPELRESENERIRKELLDFCKNRAENYPNDPKYKNISAWIAWLEKHAITNISDKLSDNEKETLNDLIKHLDWNADYRLDRVQCIKARTLLKEIFKEE